MVTEGDYEEADSDEGNPFVAFFIVAFLLGVAGYGLYYFFAPPSMTFDEAAALHEQKKREGDAKYIAQLKAKEALLGDCPVGISGTFCRMRSKSRESCDTALGGYFCIAQERDKKIEAD